MKKTSYLNCCRIFNPMVIAAGFLVGFTVNQVAFADGTETLGSPSIAIAEGAGIVAAGVGLQDTQPGAININVPGTVRQALLYWTGAVTSNAPSDDTITLNSADVTGLLIGGQAFFFNAFGKDFYYSTYRADVTALVGSGDNTLIIGGLDNKDTDGNGENSGAGLLVVYDDGSDAAEIGLKDGLDLAFDGFPEPRKSTVAQTFTFTPSILDRTASLTIFAGSVGQEGDRTSTITTATDLGTTADFVDLLGSVDGDLWDTLSIPVDIPAGASSLTVQVLSGSANAGRPASLNWVAAGLSVIPTIPTGDGCTPGYWKQPHHLDSWSSYMPSDDYETVFGVDASFSKTLLGALEQGGGGEKALGRHAVAAILNAANADVSYAYTEAEIISLVQQAYASGDFNGIKDQLALENERGCPLN